MPAKFIYLDNAATTQPDPQVVLVMREMLEEHWGNASSIHAAGSKARIRVDEARAQIATLMSCHDDEIYFTSGGTEADNWAIMGALETQPSEKNHLITTATEHHAVLDMVHWAEQMEYVTTLLPVDSEGLLDPQQLLQAMRPNTALVSVMHVNNELGTIQRVAEIGAICRERGVLFHTDCVQSFGKIPFEFSELNADLASLSSHKIYGPKGVGALVIRRGVKILPRQIGGSQERKLRPGTENVPGIAGFGMAAELCRLNLEEEIEKITSLRDILEARIYSEIPDVRLNGSRLHRAPGILNLSFLGCEGEALLIALDMKGICVSTGSACSAGAIGASHVLTALGMALNDAQASLRFSIGRFNSFEDIDGLMSVLPGIVEKQRSSAPAYLMREKI